MFCSGTQNNHVKKDQIIEAFCDVRVWLIFLSVMLSSIPNGGISNFNNILLTTLYVPLFFPLCSATGIFFPQEAPEN